MKKIFLIIFFLSISINAFCEENNDNPDILFKMGKKLEKSSPSKAVEYYSKALQLSDPSWRKKEKCLLKRGIILYNSKNIIAALKDLSKILEDNPKHFEALIYSAKSLFFLKKYSDALNLLNNAASIKNDAEVFFLQGRIYLMIFETGTKTLKINVLTAGITAFDNAIKKKRKYHQAYFHRGRAHIFLQAYEDAVNDFQKAIKIKKDYDKAWFELAKTQYYQKKHYEAIDSLEKCLEINQKHYDALLTILKLCHQYSFKEKIIKHLKNALKHYPKDLEFRKANIAYQAVPEDTLPELPKQKIKKNRRQNTPKKPKAMWLEIPPEEGKTEKSQPSETKKKQDEKIEFHSPAKPDKKKPKTKIPVFNDRQWY